MNHGPSFFATLLSFFGTTHLGFFCWHTLLSFSTPPPVPQDQMFRIRSNNHGGHRSNGATTSSRAKPKVTSSKWVQKMKKIDNDNVNVNSNGTIHIGAKDDSKLPKRKNLNRNKKRWKDHTLIHQMMDLS